MPTEDETWAMTPEAKAMVEAEDAAIAAAQQATLEAAWGQRTS